MWGMYFSIFARCEPLSKSVYISSKCRLILIEDAVKDNYSSLVIHAFFTWKKLRLTYDMICTIGIVQSLTMTTVNDNCTFTCMCLSVLRLFLLGDWLTAHNWQNWKRVFLTFPCHEIYKDEAVGQKKLQIYLKNYDLREYVEFGAISWNFDILSITA